MNKVYNVICPVCGFKKLSTEMQQRWDGLYVDAKCFERRHPSDFFRVRAEDPKLPFAYPEPTDVETSTSTWASTLTTVPTPPTDTL